MEWLRADLLPGEVVLWYHSVYGDRYIAATAFGIIGLLVLVFASGALFRTGAAVLLAIAAVAAWYDARRPPNREYILTNLRLIAETRGQHHEVTELPLRTVEAVTIKTGWGWGGSRSGSVIVRGIGGTVLELPDVPDPSRLRAELRRHTGRAESGDGGSGCS